MIFFCRHLVRLPKLTPEGYRVLMYTVKDPDYTKLVFSDAVKAFCMFNDCVLSEDGLMEGYIVCFDMKGIALGHLARVSLPALRSFMLYIQEAHPARLKAIHVLNTAPWINHAMRIVLPLIRSELLQLLKFHKGSIGKNKINEIFTDFDCFSDGNPEGVPIEIMPEEYGGEGPSIKDLDRESIEMLEKYGRWLRETELFKTDETKRIKKASWWGIFGGNTANAAATAAQIEKEKQILKDLQID